MSGAKKHHDKAKLRRSPRLSIGYSVVVHYKDKVLETHTLDVSMTGAMIAAKGHRLYPGLIVDLQFRDADGNPLFETEARVVHYSASRDVAGIELLLEGYDAGKKAS